MVLQEELPPMRESPDMTSYCSLQHVELLDQSSLLSRWSWNETCNCYYLSLYSFSFTALLTPDQMIIARKVCNIWEKYRYNSLKVETTQLWRTSWKFLLIHSFTHTHTLLSPLPSLPFARMNFSALRQF